MTSTAWFLVGVLGLALASGAEDVRGVELASPRGLDSERASQKAESQDGKEDGRTILAIQGSRFTPNGTPTSLLGTSDYGGLGASEEFMRRDLDDLHRHGFNWMRLWAT